MKQTSYRQGSWFAVAGPKACVLLPGSQKQRAVELWSMVDDGADFDDVLDTLVAQGLRGLSGFVLISGDTDVRVLVRGESVVTVESASGTRELTGAGTLTWTEASVTDVNSLTVVVDLSDGELLPLRGGLVRVGELVVGTPAPISAPAAAVPVAVPVADPLGIDTAAESVDGADLDLPGAGLAASGAALAGVAPVLSVVPGGSWPDSDSDSDDVLGPADLEAVPAFDEEPDADLTTQPEPEVEDGPELDIDHAYDEVADDEQAEWEAEESELAELLDETADDDGMATTDGPQASHLDDDVVESILEVGSDDPTDVDLPVVPDALGAPPAWTPDELGPPPPAPPSGLPPVPPAPPILSEDPLALADAPLGPPPAWTPAPLDEEEPDEPEAVADPEDENPTEFIPQAPAPARAAVRLVFSDGQDLAADATLVVGRAPDVSRSTDPDATGVRVPSPHQEISSTHVEIQSGEGHAAVIVTDLGSTNGTVVVQPGAGPEELRPGVPVALITGSMIDLGDGLTIQVQG